MIQPRAEAVGLPKNIPCHLYRATGLAEYLRNRGTVENATQITAHESIRTTRFYNRVDDTLTVDSYAK
jgi:integrase/recombinase XerD